jgi:hypothetical protein
MKRSEEVFFFTLIDFLLQIVFLALLLYVLSEATAPQDRVTDQGTTTVDKSILQKALGQAGVSNLSQLTDLLSRLRPDGKLGEAIEKIEKYGGLSTATQAAKMASDAGGIEELAKKVKKYEEAYGLPPCHKDESGNRIRPLSMANLEIFDDQIKITRIHEYLGNELRQAGFIVNDGESLSISRFREVFQAIRRGNQNCIHFVDVTVSTAFYRPVQAVFDYFRNARTANR